MSEVLALGSVHRDTDERSDIDEHRNTHQQPDADQYRRTANHYRIPDAHHHAADSDTAHHHTSTDDRFADAAHRQ